MPPREGGVSIARPAMQDPGGLRIHPHSSRRVRLTLATAFFATTVALLAVTLVLLVAVKPQLDDLVAISDRHARAVSLLANLRGRLAVLRSDLVMAVTEGRSGPTPSVSSELLHTRTATEELDVLAESAFEQQSLHDLRREIRSCAREAARVEEALSRRADSAARAELPSFIDANSRADQSAERLVTFNAGQVQQSAARVGRLVRRTAVGGILAALLGVGAALVLLVFAFVSFRNYSFLLERQARELSDFAGRAAHELRTPLQTFALTLALIRREPTRTGAIDRAEQSVRRLANTIESLLQFARAGGAPAPDGRADVAAIVEELTVDLAPRLSSASMRLECFIHPGIEVAMAPAHLRTVLMNLVANAAKYGHNEAGGRVCITVQARAGTAELRVEDEGPGIAPEVVPRVFDPLYRGTSGGEGSGLGLATVKRLVEAHAGTVAVDSVIGRGTVVVVRLPTRTFGSTPPGVRPDRPRAPTG